MPNYLVSAGGSNSGCCVTSCPDASCKDTVRFFGDLATKLLEMAESVNTRIEKIKAEACKPTERGIILAKIDVQPAPIGVGGEFIEYVKRYGPPTNGIFDPVLLQQLRTELGFSTTI